MHLVYIQENTESKWEHFLKTMNCHGCNIPESKAQQFPANFAIPDEHKNVLQGVSKIHQVPLCLFITDPPLEAICSVSSWAALAHSLLCKSREESTNRLWKQPQLTRLNFPYSWTSTQHAYTSSEPTPLHASRGLSSAKCSTLQQCNWDPTWGPILKVTLLFKLRILSPTQTAANEFRAEQLCRHQEGFLPFSKGGDWTQAGFSFPKLCDLILHKRLNKV